MERDHGRIVSVSTRTLGSVLDGDHAAGATSLVLFDAGDFDETGGTLSLNGATLAYASVDDDADTITLTDPLPAAALDGDFVACWDTLYNVAVTKTTAMVQLDGDDDNPDPIECYVPRKIAEDLKPGDRGGPGEDCEIEYIEEDDEWRVTDVRGLSDQAGQKFEADDFYTLTADDITAGTVTFPLSHAPIQDSLTAWCGIPQPPTEFTIDYNAPSITFPLAGFEEAGDDIWVHYAYRDAPRPASILTLVDWSAPSWKYLVTTETDSTDRSAPTFDDSGWTVGPAPFGGPDATTDPLQPDWPAPVTVTGKDVGVWLRRTVSVPAGASAVSVNIRVDGSAWAYWNGELIGSRVGDGTAEVGPLTVPSSALGGGNVLAVKAVDDVADPPAERFYIDAQVTAWGNA